MWLIKDVQKSQTPPMSCTYSGDDAFAILQSREVSLVAKFIILYIIFLIIWYFNNKKLFIYK